MQNQLIGVGPEVLCISGKFQMIMVLLVSGPSFRRKGLYPTYLYTVISWGDFYVFCICSGM